MNGDQFARALTFWRVDVYGNPNLGSMPLRYGSKHSTMLSNEEVGYKVES